MKQFWNILLRLTGLPFLTVLVVIRAVIGTTKFLINFMMYGGEFISYSKDERKTISDIYILLKELTQEEE
jgi:hypothetical protein